MKRTMATLALASGMLLSIGGDLRAGQETTPTVLRPAAVFDGEALHRDWVVVVSGDRITAAGPAAEVAVPSDAERLDLDGLTLLPGLIEGHSHILLHPYNETPWTDQVLYESLAERTARAVVHAAATLRAGVTTIRDLGTEGAGYADAGSRTPSTRASFPDPG